MISYASLTLTLHHVYFLYVFHKKLTLEWLNSEKDDPRNPKVPLTWSIKYGAQGFFNFTNINAELLFSLHMRIAYLYKTINTTSSLEVNIKSM